MPDEQELQDIKSFTLREIAEVRKEVDDLYKTIYKGNGSPSLVTRVNDVEGKLRGLREQIKEKFDHISSQHQLKFDLLNDKLESKFGRLEGWIETRFNNVEEYLNNTHDLIKQNQSGSWKLTAAIITAISGIVSSVLYLLFR